VARRRRAAGTGCRARKPAPWQALAALCLGALFAVPPATAAATYSPGVGADYPVRAYFGDLHLHTSYSADAFSMGNLSLGPADAYRFARGEEVTSSSGLPARLRRPLDFLAVTDHAEFLGIYRAYQLGEPALRETALAGYWDRLAAEYGNYFRAFPDSITDPDRERDAYPERFKHTIWRDVTRTADEYNEPGVFTTFSGYEWTSMVDGNNLHRCVIFRDDSTTVSRVLPFSAQESRDPEDLWSALEHYERATGGSVLAIPHNGNLSNGLMFDTTTLAGEPLSAAYARSRMRWEPVVEVTQIKGDGETHPLLSPEDEFADFERWDSYNIMHTQETTAPMLPGSYARSALKRGLAEERRMGVNPYQFGMIGSTDDHTALATAAEDNFFGKFANSEPGIRSAESRMAGVLNADWELGAAGLVAVWARENTREALFDSLRRREVYATTGSRIVLRFWGGWDFPRAAAQRPDVERIGYERGVPMGSVLPQAGDSDAPTFMVVAMKDPYAANLDQIQIIKGWIDADGKTHETIHYVALSDGRSVDPATGKPPPVGSTVDLETVSYRNSIGDAQLAGQWTDPDFDPAQSAFYYARVIEIPTPRWSEYDRRYFGVSMPEEAPKTVQDRAYSSPIWYRPPKPGSE
jgi:hypothetical protein